MDICYKKLDDTAKEPTCATVGSAGYDLYATTKTWDEKAGVIVYGTGIAMEIPSGYVGLLFPRSSIKNYNLRLANSVGVIDSDYRGEIKVCFDIIDVFDPITGERYEEVKEYEVGDRVAQLVIVPCLTTKLKEVEELNGTTRNKGGFGHTGKR